MVNAELARLSDTLFWVALAVYAGAMLLLRSDQRTAQRHFDLPGIAMYGSALILLLVTMTAAGTSTIGIPTSTSHVPGPWAAVSSCSASARTARSSPSRSA